MSDDARTSPRSRVVTVTSAQRRAAATMVERSLKTGRELSPSVRKIAEARPAERP